MTGRHRYAGCLSWSCLRDFHPLRLTRARSGMRRYRPQLSCILGAAALALMISRPALAQWAPPLGIPSPSFGIQQSAPASPSPWVVGTPGFYYVDASSAAASDRANPL